MFLVQFINTLDSNDWAIIIVLFIFCWFGGSQAFGIPKGLFRGIVFFLVALISIVYWYFKE